VRLHAALEELLAGGGADLESYLQNYEQMLSEGLVQQQAPQLNQVDSEGGITVRPDPGFVVKTRDTQSGMKVFLNIVSNEHVEGPHMKSLAELDGQEGCRVPLSIGTPVEDFDKKNEPCVTYDLVANPDVVKECKNTPAFRDTLVELCFAAVAQKYKVGLDPKYKLPKMTYKGNVVQLQRIRKQKQTQIQELAGNNAGTAASGTTTSAEEEKGPKRPDFIVFYASRQALEGPDCLPLPDGFKYNWGPPPEEIADAEGVSFLCGWDLPCYRVNAFQEKIRGTMKNKADQKRAEEAAVAENAEAPGVRETREMLRGRTCVVQIPMPNLDRHVPALKQFGVEVSDECLRLTFPMLPRSGRSAYAPLTIWWPRLFCAAQASSQWDAKADVLTITLPTEAPAEASAFDQDLLDAVF